MSDSPLSRLCQACGLCCAGALFTHVRLTEADEARLCKAGVPVTTRRNGQRVLSLGCSALRGTACGIYEARPAGCRAFVCDLGQQLERGTTSFEGAMAVVAEAQRLFARVESELPPEARQEPGSPLKRAKAHGLSNGPAALREAESYLRWHFLGE